jgi:hypothetical protein
VLKLDYLDRRRLCCPHTPQQRALLPSESKGSQAALLLLVRSDSLVGVL